MCIGLPMQVLSSTPGHALCSGRGETRTVRTALVGPVAVGDWLLVFLDSAQEQLDAARAREIEATLDLLAQAMAGDASGDAAFTLPSSMAPAELRALVGEIS
ncbi:HypC/HybG/HupF family hydrogenase formation chaperone [Pseudorhodoferax sp. Leaf267]|uniref:HypC/HybG/HupF family hydrogenase formation chaperone n=1 Tax=Pseudorhodoferax sp. Leaf267 TaxID=1736316 RepID=UPI0007017210|nr:HypC/HybG/HupF family hydrogenase formation chaperone [Pseudorhodoferax sp. Leaf267]KQP15006.1 hydrogenase [Pseudorhodoferax sp. Leaf267]